MRFSSLCQGLTVIADDRIARFDVFVHLGSCPVWQVYAPVRTAVGIDISSKSPPPVRIMEANPSIERHPVSHRCFIGISRCITFQYKRRSFVIQCISSCRGGVSLGRISGNEIAFQDHHTVPVHPEMLTTQIYLYVRIPHITVFSGGCRLGIDRLSLDLAFHPSEWTAAVHSPHSGQ